MIIPEIKSAYITTVEIDSKMSQFSIKAKAKKSYDFMKSRLRQFRSIAGLDGSEPKKFDYKCEDSKQVITFTKDMLQAVKIIRDLEIISNNTFDILSNLCGNKKKLSEYDELSKQIHLLKEIYTQLGVILKDPSIFQKETLSIKSKFF